jgi:hypothetical protein
MTKDTAEPDLIALLPGAKELLYREAPTVARVLIIEGFRFVHAHPELKPDIAGRAYAFLAHVREMPIAARGEETTVGAEVFRLGGGGVELLRPLLAMIDGHGTLRDAMVLERGRLDRAVRRIEEAERVTS